MEHSNLFRGYVTQKSTYCQVPRNLKPISLTKTVSLFLYFVVIKRLFLLLLSIN